MSPMQLIAITLFTPKNKAGSRSKASIYDINIDSLQGQAIDLNQYQGKKMLFVNVASKCGFTNQYKDLQKLHEKYTENLVIIGVPSNQFGKQEPGSASEIQEFCQINYGVDFTITEKVDVKGDEQHPLYQWLTKKTLNGRKNASVKWNFQKYLVDEKGELIDYYLSSTQPMSSKITKHLS